MVKNIFCKCILSIYVNYVKIFLPKFFAKHFDEWGKEAPNYEADFEKGIPAAEYGALSEKLSSCKTYCSVNAPLNSSKHFSKEKMTSNHIFMRKNSKTITF